MPDRDRCSLILANGSRYRWKMLPDFHRHHRLPQAPVDRLNGPPTSCEPDIGAQDEISLGVGTGDKRDPFSGKIFDIEPEPKPSRDFRITDAHRIGQGSLHEKARDNIAAIRFLKTLEAENRYAADDEKPVLARYVGWGGMPNVFGYTPPGEWRTTAAAVKELLMLRGPVTVGVFQVFNYCSTVFSGVITLGLLSSVR